MRHVISTGEYFQDDVDDYSVADDVDDVDDKAEASDSTHLKWRLAADDVLSDFQWPQAIDKFYTPHSVVELERCESFYGVSGEFTRSLGTGKASILGG